MKHYRITPLGFVLIMTTLLILIIISASLYRTFTEDHQLIYALNKAFKADRHLYDINWSLKTHGDAVLYQQKDIHVFHKLQVIDGKVHLSHDDQTYYKLADIEAGINDLGNNHINEDLMMTRKELASIKKYLHKALTKGDQSYTLEMPIHEWQHMVKDYLLDDLDNDILLQENNYYASDYLNRLDKSFKRLFLDTSLAKMTFSLDEDGINLSLDVKLYYKHCDAYENFYLTLQVTTEDLSINQ